MSTPAVLSVALAVAQLALAGGGTAPAERTDAALRERPAASRMVVGAHTPAGVVERLTREALEAPLGRPSSAAEAPAAADLFRSMPVQAAGTILMERGSLLGGLLLLLCAGMVVARAGRRRTRTPDATRNHHGMNWAARSLVAGGASATDVSRRTGIPQDALAALVALDRSPAGAARGRP